MLGLDHRGKPKMTSNPAIVVEVGAQLMGRIGKLYPTKTSVWCKSRDKKNPQPPLNGIP